MSDTVIDFLMKKGIKEMHYSDVVETDNFDELIKIDSSCKERN